MTKRVSIKDIATRVGVSTALVSYVLNGLEKEKRVGKEVVEKVKKAAEELNYQPNQIARSLRKGSTSTIGLIVADIANPFFGHLARNIEDEASNYKYVVILGSSDEDFHKSESLAETFLNRQVDGFIIVPSEGDDQLIKTLIRKEVPLVLIDRRFPEVDCNFVTLDNFEATFNATNSLLKNGFRRIKMVAYQSDMNHMTERIEGYMAAMKNAGREENIRIEKVGLHANDLQQRISEIILQPETDAILFATNTLTIAGLYALQKNKLEIPERLAVVGFDGSESFDFFNPPISYIEQPLKEMGAKAVHLLYHQINGQTETTGVKMKSNFIERESSRKIIN